MTIGSYPEIGIAVARDKHAELRSLVARGIDPIDLKRRDGAQKEIEARSSVSFKQFAQQWIKDTLCYRSESYRTQTIRFLDSHVNPTIGSKPLKDVRPADVLEVVEAIRHIPTTADRCRALIQQIFNHAVSKRAYGICRRSA